MNLKNISIHRSELMGLATLMIIFCHGPANGVQMPALIEKVVRWGGTGVDVFLLLSGIGMFFSLQKKQKLSAWYRHRYLRILVPFLLFSIPYYLFRSFVEHTGILPFLENITTISYWTNHEGAWFVALLIPLYLLTPWTAKFIDGFENRLAPTLALCLASSIICWIPASTEFFLNFQMFFAHAPSFFMGYWLGKNIFEERMINKRFCVEMMGGVFLFVIIFVFAHRPLIWLILPLIIIGCVGVLGKIHQSIVSKLFLFMGSISLESYLTNIYLPYVFQETEIANMIENYDRGNYLFYLLIIVVGVLFAYLGHMLSQALLNINKIRSY